MTEMAEETGQQTETTPPVAETPPAAAEAAPDWTKLIEGIDAKELRRHPKVAGLIGSEVENARRSVQQRQSEEQAKRARELVEDEFERLALENSDTLKERYPRLAGWIQEQSKARQEREVAEKLQEVRAEMAGIVGRSFHTLPDWSELTPNDLETLAKAVSGKQDDEVIGAYNAAALSLLAERRSKKHFEEWKTKQLETERKALRKEIAAEFMAKSESPDSTKAKRVPPPLDIKRMSKEDFDKLYDSTFLDR